MRFQTVRASPCRAAFRSLARSTRALIAFEARLQIELTTAARFRYIYTMKAPLQTGFSGRVPAPPEERFLINWRLCGNTYISRMNSELLARPFGGVIKDVMQVTPWRSKT